MLGVAGHVAYGVDVCELAAALTRRLEVELMDPHIGCEFDALRDGLSRVVGPVVGMHWSGV